MPVLPQSKEALKGCWPIFAWLPNYRRRDLASDIIAGVVVSMVLVPTAMAYAQLAGLPAQHGLYSCILPMILYAAFSNSPVLSVAPVTVVSIIAGGVIAPLAPQGSLRAVEIAAALALLSAIIFFAFAWLRLGVITNFVSQPVMNGCISAVGVVVVCSQLPVLIGLQIQGAATTPRIVAKTLDQLNQSQIVSTCIGFASLALLVWRERIVGWVLGLGSAPASTKRTLSSAMPLVAAATGVVGSYLFNLQETAGVRVVGHIPYGLPPLQPPPVMAMPWIELAPGALVLSIVGFIESIAVAKVLARRRGEQVDLNRELTAMGAANAGAACTGGYPVSAGLFRSALNIEAGAATPLAGIVTAACILFTLMFLGKALQYLPQPVLAAVVVSSSLGLIKFGPLRRAWARTWQDATGFVVTFAAIIFLGIEAGLLLGIGTSIVLHAGWAIGQWVKGTPPANRSVPDLIAVSDTVVVEAGDNLYFGNVHRLQDRILAAIESSSGIVGCIVDVSKIARIDSTAADALESLAADLAKSGITLTLLEKASRNGAILDHPTLKD